MNHKLNIFWLFSFIISAILFQEVWGTCGGNYRGAGSYIIPGSERGGLAAPTTADQTGTHGQTFWDYEKLLECKHHMEQIQNM